MEDYGPVYAFWLFAFERMNGIMGSFHTNNRSIPVQLAQRFFNSKEYAPLKWSKEFADEFIPLLERHRYSQGSLSQAGLRTDDPKSNIIPLPLLQEAVWQPHQLTKLTSLLGHEGEI